MEWDVPYEPTLVADITLYIPYYSDICPLFGVKWQQWYDSNGASGEEPPDWAKRMFDIARSGRRWSRAPTRYTELGKELVKLNLENMTLDRHDRRAAEAGHRVATSLHNVKARACRRCTSTSATSTPIVRTSGTIKAVA